MDSGTVAIVGAAIALVGTVTAGWFGYRAKLAEQRMAAQTAAQQAKSKEVEAAAGTTLNERQEATAIRVAQREQIERLNERLEARDEENDELKTKVRRLESTVERQQGQIERQQNQIETLQGQVATLLRELGRANP